MAGPGLLRFTVTVTGDCARAVPVSTHAIRIHVFKTWVRIISFPPLLLGLRSPCTSIRVRGSGKVLLGPFRSLEFNARLQRFASTGSCFAPHHCRWARRKPCPAQLPLSRPVTRTLRDPRQHRKRARIGGRRCSARPQDVVTVWRCAASPSWLSG